MSGRSRVSRPVIQAAVGVLRPICPALTRKVRCPNYPRRAAANIPITTCPQGGCSCGEIITINRDDPILKHFQSCAHDTTAWVNSYYRRNGVDSFNSSIKTHHYKLSRDSIRVLTQPKVTIWLGIATAVTNLSTLLACYGIDPTLPDTMPRDGETATPLPAVKKPCEQRAPRPTAPATRTIEKTNIS